MYAIIHKRISSKGINKTTWKIIYDEKQKKGEKYSKIVCWMWKNKIKRTFLHNKVHERFIQQEKNVK